jgi:hypothetical protein
MVSLVPGHNRVELDFRAGIVLQFVFWVCFIGWAMVIAAILLKTVALCRERQGSDDGILPTNQRI